MTGRVWKYGGGVSTPTVATRVVLTAVTLAPGSVLVTRIIRETYDSHLERAGFMFFLLGAWVLAAIAFLPHVWRPSAEWRRRKYQARQLQRQLTLALEPRRQLNRALHRARSAYCPVCGQQGMSVAVSRTVCSACQRPWAAGKAMPTPLPDVSRPPSVIDLRNRVASHS